MHLLVFTISYFHLHFQFYFHYIARIKRKIFRINIYKNYYRIYVVLYTFFLNILKGYYFDFIIYWSMKDIHKSLQSVSDQLIQMKGSWCNWPSSSHIDRMLSELQNSILHDQDNTLSSTDHTTPHTERLSFNLRQINSTSFQRGRMRIIKENFLILLYYHFTKCLSNVMFSAQPYEMKSIFIPFIGIICSVHKPFIR